MFGGGTVDEDGAWRKRKRIKMMMKVMIMKKMKK
jgi:hypothetical protein